MNSSENDVYWEESELKKKSNFFNDDDKDGDPILLEDIIDTSNSIRIGPESSSHSNSAQSSQIESISKYLSEQCINCILESENERQESICSDNLPVEEEVRLLRRKMMERWTVPKEQVTINNILLGQPYSLELYRSLNDKKRLLKYAINSADGDAILAVVVYLSKTLKASLFHQLLNDYPVAASHFIHYLYTRRKMQEISDLLEVLGKSKEAVMKYLTVASQNPHRLLQRLRLLLKNPSVEPYDYKVIENYSKLVEWQMSASKTTGDQSIVGESAVQTLKFSCVHKLSIPLSGDNSKTESQPNYLAKCLRVPEKQSLMATIRGNAELKQWESIEQLLIVKSWVGGKKLGTNLPIDKLLDELQKCGASNSLIDNILMLLDNDKKIEVARKLGRHGVVIETFGKKKDKGGLLQYMSYLDIKSADYIYAETVLQTMGPKWKT